MENILLQIPIDTIQNSTIGGKIGEYWAILSLVSAAIGGLITWILTSRKTNAEIEKTLLEISELKMTQIEKLNEKRGAFELLKKKIKELIIEILSLESKGDVQGVREKRKELINSLRSEYVQAILDYTNVFLIFNEKGKTIKRRFSDNIIIFLKSILKIQNFVNNPNLLNLINEEKFHFNEIELIPFKHHIDDITTMFQKPKRIKVEGIIKKMSSKEN